MTFEKKDNVNHIKTYCIKHLGESSFQIIYKREHFQLEIPKSLNPTLVNHSNFFETVFGKLKIRNLKNI